MKTPHAVTVYCLSTAQSPITHMAKSVGNRGIIARERVVTPYGERMVPFLTGNALRHSALRRPGFDWLARIADMDEGLTQPELYFLTSGGSGYVGNGGRESSQFVCDFRSLCPLGGLLGGTLPAQIIGGRVNVDRGTLVCSENAARLDTYLPDGVSVADLTLRDSARFIGDWQYTRSRNSDGLAPLIDIDADFEQRGKVWSVYDGKDKPESASEMWLAGEDKDKSAQMIFGGECVIPGAVFVHRFTMIHPERLEVGALLWSLRLWREQGNTIGGMAARGHGILDTAVLVDHELPGAEDEYVDHVMTNGPKVKDWLRAQFRKPVSPPKKKGTKTA